MENNRYGLLRQGSGIWRSLRDGDFQEQDVWDMLDEHNDYSRTKISQTIEASLSVQRPLASAARMIPRSTSNVSSCCSVTSYEAKGEVTIRRQSAPVNIPDWPKMCGKKAKKAASIHGDDDDDDVDDRGNEYDDDDDDGSNDNVSSEEFFLAMNRSSSFSVIEGVGRTLKGRDLSQVRNAVLKQTGFLE